MPRDRFPLCLLIALAVCCGVVTWSSSAAPPRTLGSDLIQSGNLTPAQQQQIDQWVQYYTAQLVNAAGRASERAIQDVEDASEKLRDPLIGVFQPSESFRLRYSTVALPELRKAIKSSNLHVAVNALLVVSELKSTKALDLAMDHSDVANEGRMQVRLRAAAAVRSILGSGNVAEGRMVNIARRLRRAAENEEHDVILRYHLQAIATASKAPGVNDAVAREVRAIWTDTLKQTIDQIAKRTHPTPLLIAVRSELPQFRKAYIDLPANERKQIGERMGPALGDLMGLPLVHDTSAPEMRRLRSTYQETVQISQEFLKFVDRDVRPSDSLPSSDLAGIMKNGWGPANRQQFETELGKLRSVLSKPPYRK